MFPADTGAVFNSDPRSLWPQMIQKTMQKIAGNVPASAPAVASMRMENFVTAAVSTYHP
jgi:hypothetical protein